MCEFRYLVSSNLWSCSGRFLNKRALSNPSEMLGIFTKGSNNDESSSHNYNSYTNHCPVNLRGYLCKCFYKHPYHICQKSSTAWGGETRSYVFSVVVHLAHILSSGKVKTLLSFSTELRVLQSHHWTISESCRRGGGKVQVSFYIVIIIYSSWKMKVQLNCFWNRREFVMQPFGMLGSVF